MTAQTTQPSSTTVETIEAIRPLNATASRSLLKLVRNDFETMENELRMFGQEVQTQRMSEADASFREQKAKAEKIEAAVEKAKAKCVAEIRKIVADNAGVEGLSVKFEANDRYNGRFPDVEVSVTGLDEAHSRVYQETRDDLDKARASLKREHLKAERAVLLASITSEVQAVLDSIPTAKSLLEGAAAERKAVSA